MPGMQRVRGECIECGDWGEKRDCFGPAFSVKDPSGQELVRFVENGNVIVFKGPLHPQYTLSWAGIGNTNSFVIVNNASVKKAVVTPEGEFFLAGSLHEDQESLQAPTGNTAFIIRDHAATAQSYIDDTGSLYARGKVIVKGVPYTLEQDQTTDPYFTYP